ncbi:5-methylcytosine-specific restriction endonuclease McrA [Williamsia sp. R60]
MPLRPCTECGEPHEGTGRCDPCRRAADTARERPASRAHQGTARWTRLSTRLRALAPFCETCGSTKSLEVDHILPVLEFPELVYVMENLRVLCRVCNRSRGHRWTDAEAWMILQRLQEAYDRTRRSTYRHALLAAERAVQPQGGHPLDLPRQPRQVAAIRVTHRGASSQIVRHSDQEVGT